MLRPGDSDAPGRVSLRKEIEMAIVVVAVIPGGNEETYEKISAKVMSDGQLPDGCQLHVAGPVDEGWRVVTVWDSPAHLERFREKLRPAVREAGVEDEIVPQVNPVYRVIIA
jgi:hypothetical protein